jgi:hypothetical protein
VNLVVHHHQHAAALGLRIGGDANCVEKVERPSALTAVDGRIEPTITTGLSVFTVKFRKYADSSRVSVPCVMTKPWMLGS